MQSSYYQKIMQGLRAGHLCYSSPAINMISKHIHSEYEFLYIINGDLTYIVEDKKYKLKKHDLVITTPNQYHLIQIDSPAQYERYNILFDPKVLGIEDPLPYLSDIFVINCKHIPIITGLFQKMDYYAAIMDDEKFFKLVVGFIRELLYNIDIEKSFKNAPEQNIHPLVKSALKIINDKLPEQISIKEIASSLYITESYFFKLFKQELKTTPHKYINEKRMFNAKEMILQGTPPTQAYLLCGFSDYASFYRNYIKLFKISPSKEKSKSTQN